MDTEHSLFGDHGLDSTKPAIPDLVSSVHNTMRDLRLGLQDSRQYWFVGQLPAVGDHRYRGFDQAGGDIVIVR